MRQLYNRLCEEKGFSTDPAQEDVLNALEKLRHNLEKYLNQSLWKRWITKNQAPQGMYIYGDVGRGKTMLMDLFFQALQVKKKQRLHFHVFMQHIHQALQERRIQKQGDQPIDDVVSQWKEKADVLCFDEFHITDIADAMILRRLFDGLWEQGIVIIATSNFKPEDLYLNGLHRECLYPFFKKIYQSMTVICLDSAVDYRYKILSRQRRYFYPLNQQTQKEIEDLYHQLSRGLEESPVTLHVQGRALPIQQARGRICVFPFSFLCEQSLGRDDYLEICKHYDTLILQGVPYFDERNQDAAKRFIILIDILYDQGTTLILSAVDKPDNLYRQGFLHENLFDRMRSRVIEMTGFLEA